MDAAPLSPRARDHALEEMASGPELDVLVVGGGVVGNGAALDAATRGLRVGLVEGRDWASGTSSRSSKLVHGGLRYLEMLDFGLVREALRERGLIISRLAPHLVKPVSFLYPLPTGSGSGRTSGPGCCSTTRWGWRRGLARVTAPPAPDPPRRAAAGARPSQGLADRRRAVLRRPGRRRQAHDVTGPHRGVLRRAVRIPRPGRAVPARGRAGHRGPHPGPGTRPHVRRTGPSGHQRHRRMDRRNPVDGGRARAVQGARVQGCAPGRAARPDPLRHRDDPAYRAECAVRHPVGSALDRRHDRHRLGAGQGPSGRVGAGHRLHPHARSTRCS